MISTIGIIGTGIMGSGIAYVCTLAGYKVLINDTSPKVLDTCLAEIDRNMEKLVARNKLSDSEKKEALSRLTKAPTYKALKECDLIIEAVAENQDLKKEVFAEVTPFLSPNCILATNTSSLSITSLAQSTNRADKFIGMHFMNPVPIMHLVEIIRGIETSKETYEAIQTVVQRLGKQSVLAEDYPGFIVNRVLMPMINEAIYALFEGVGTVEAIDKGMKLGTNQPMGPLELADLIGLDTCASIMEVLYKGFGDPKYKPCPLLRKYVEAGWLGRKSKRGFYDYTGEQPSPIDRRECL